jgi:uncharacterized protein
MGLPAAWLAGAMIAVAAAALAGVPVAVPTGVRFIAFVFLGLSMGTTVTPETVKQVAAWPFSLALLALSVITTLAVGAAYLRRVHGWDAATARFSAVPGALAAVLVLAAASSANLPRVAFAQTIRLFTLVAVMPSIIRLVSGTPAAMQTHLASPLATGSTVDNLITLAASAAAALLLHKLKVPAGVLLGAMLASAGLHAAGLVSGRPPQAVLIGGFVVTGAVIGSRFRGTKLSLLRSTIRGALEAVLLALAISAGFAALGAYWLQLPFGQLWLAYAPGGVEVMAVMALALGLDAAFVGAHHVLRLLGLNLLSPLWRRSARE